MAADGDLFQKRVSYGWGKVYSAICDGMAPAELPGLLLKALRNMLRDDLRTPALGALIAAAHELLLDHSCDLFPEGRLAQEAQIQARFDDIERAYLDYGSSELARRACQAVVNDLLDHPTAGGLSRDQVATACCEQYYETLCNRFGFDPMQSDVMHKRGFSREQMEGFRAEALAVIREKAVSLLRQVAGSKTGTPPRRRSGTTGEAAAIEHTAQGLEEALATLP